MIKKYIFAVLALVPFLLSASVASAQDQWTGNINMFLGQKNLDKDDWEPVEEQGEFGIEVDFREKDWPVNIAIDVLASSDDQSIIDPFFGQVDLEGKTTEFNIGIRKIWDESSVRPFIGGGLSYIRAEAKVTIPGFGSEERRVGKECV